jgi:hypothetical protein
MRRVHPDQQKEEGGYILNAPDPVTAVEQEAPDLTGMNVYQRLNAIKKEVTYIQKDKKVESYYAVTHDAVTRLTHPHFVRWGVLVEPHELSSVTVLSGMTTAKGIPYVRFEGRYRVDFVNVDIPSERASIDVTAHALDHGDKAPGKGLSYATKAAVLKMLQLESGETEADEARPADVKAAQGEKISAGKISGTDGAVEALKPERREAVTRVLSSIVDCFEAGMEPEAFKAYSEVTDQDERVALWHLLKPHSKMRRRLKDMAEAARLAAGHKPPERDPAAHRRD